MLGLRYLLYENRQGLASLLNPCKIRGNLNKVAILPVSFCYLSLTYVYIYILSKNHIVLYAKTNISGILNVTKKNDQDQSQNHRPTWS